MNTDFRPFGISILGDLLFAINEGYGNGGEAVLIFRILPNWKLKLVNKYQFDESKLGVFNSIQPLSHDSFLITQYRSYPDPVQGRQHDRLTVLKNLIANYFFQDSYVFYCKIGQQCVRQEETKDKFNNGIATDKHGRVFVSNTLDKKISVFDYKEG